MTIEDLKKLINERLLHYKHESLANDINVSSSHLSMFLHGERGLHIDTVLNLLSRLDLKLTDKETEDDAEFKRLLVKEIHKRDLIIEELKKSHSDN